MLYPNVSKPLYEQLKQALNEHIKTGLYKPGEPLPGERQLMNIYKVSRMTVRQAIGELVNEGVLYRKQGLGTFVREKASEFPTTKLYGLVEELVLTGHEVSTNLLSSGIEEPDAETARALGLEANEKVYCYSRIITEKGIPLLYTKSHIHGRLSQLFMAIDGNLPRDIIYEHFEHCGYQISHADQKISAGNPTKEEAEYLQCNKNSPIIIVQRVTYLKGGSPIMYSRHLYQHDYALTLYLER